MFTPIILALKRLRQEDGHEFRNSLDYKVRLPQKGRGKEGREERKGREREGGEGGEEREERRGGRKFFSRVCMVAHTCSFP